MRGDVRFAVDGVEHVIRLSLGALEGIQEEGYAPATVYYQLGAGGWYAKEMSATLRAAIAETGAAITVDEMIDKLGMMETSNIAFRALHEIFKAPEGNADAAAGQTTAAANSDS